MPRTATATKTTWEAKVPQLKPGKYADGMPLHQLHYLCCKLILRPNHFSSRASLFDFEKVLRAPAKRSLTITQADAGTCRWVRTRHCRRGLAKRCAASS